MPVRTEKNRYIALKVKKPEDISKDELKNYIRKTLRSYPSIQNLKIVSNHNSKNIFIIRCGHQHVKLLKKKLNTLEICGRHVLSEVLLISGTLNTLRRKLGFTLS